MSDFVPLSARHSRWRRLRWEWKGVRQWTALRLAPWLSSVTPFSEGTRVRISAPGRWADDRTGTVVRAAVGEHVLVDLDGGGVFPAYASELRLRRLA